MPSDIRSVLDRAAAHPTSSLNLEAIRGQGRKLAWQRRAFAISSLVAITSLVWISTQTTFARDLFGNEIQPVGPVEPSPTMQFEPSPTPIESDSRYLFGSGVVPEAVMERALLFMEGEYGPVTNVYEEAESTIGVWLELEPRHETSLSIRRLESQDVIYAIFIQGQFPAHSPYKFDVGRLIVDGEGKVLDLRLWRDRKSAHPPFGPNLDTSALDLSDVFCVDRAAVPADVDGDSEVDQVFHEWIGGTARLGVCIAAGGQDSISGLGQSELFGIHDVQGDGRDEIFYGSTSMSSGTYQVAVFLEGNLVVVTDRTGSPLRMERGIGNATGEREDRVGLAFGCEDVDGDGHDELVQVSATFRDHIDSQGKVDDIKWDKVAYSINGAEATESTTESSFVPGSKDDLLDVAYSEVEPCFSEQ